MVVAFTETGTTTLNTPLPSATVVAVGDPEQMPFLKISTVAFGSATPSTFGEGLFEGEAGVVPVSVGAGGVAKVTKNDDERS